jgi:hypothetical protein
MLALLLVSAILQQQPTRAAALQREASSAEFDSTTQQVALVGSAVAEVKSYLDLFRRAVFNGSDGDVLTAAGAFGQHCHWLEIAALRASRKVCRHCGSPEVQRALEGYRGVMPTVARTGARCAATIGRLQAATSQHQAAVNLRHDVRAIGDAIVAGLTRYESRLQALRVAAGWAPQAPPPPNTRPSGG